MTANRCAYLNTSWNTLPKQHPRPTLQSTVFATAAAAKPWPDGSKSTCLSKHVWSNTPPSAVMTLTSRDWPHYGPLYYARRPFLQNAPSSPSLAAPGTTSTFLEKIGTGSQSGHLSVSSVCQRQLHGSPEPSRPRTLYPCDWTTNRKSRKSLFQNTKQPLPDRLRSRPENVVLIYKVLQEAKHRKSLVG